MLRRALRSTALRRRDSTSNQPSWLAMHAQFGSTEFQFISMHGSLRLLTASCSGVQVCAFFWYLVPFIQSCGDWTLQCTCIGYLLFAALRWDV